MAEVAKGLVEPLVQALCIAKKDAKIYYLKFPVIMFGLVFPFFLYFAFYVGRQIQPSVLVPGIVGIASFFGASSIEVAAFTYERGRGTLERLLTAPVSLFTVVLGKAFAGSAFGFILSMIFAAIIIPLSGAPLTNPALFIIAIALSSITFAAFGMPISVYPKSPPEAMMPLNLVRLPMIFLCGVFIPVEALPPPLQVLSYSLPLTYTVDALRQATTGPFILRFFLIDVAALIVYSIVLLAIATKMLRRGME